MRLLPLLVTLTLALPATAQPFAEKTYGEMRWRMIGPFRGGRTVAASGVPGKPNVFYIAANNGGVWKSDDYGHVWTPIFDDQPTGSIGALAVAPSKPDVVYVGSGEGLQRPDLSVGDGVYKSTDAGKTWRHTGLRDAQQIPAILVDPRDPDRVYVASLGHPYGPNAERGVFRSTNGGGTWDRVLYRDENTGAVALAFDPKDAKVLYAVLWEARLGPWENGDFRGPGSGLHKSTDGGTTWRPIGKGFPTFAEGGLGRIGIAVAPSDGSRVYALVEASRTAGGLYRSTDAGETFARVNTDTRLWGRGSDFAEVKVDPRNADVVWVGNIAAHRSTDGGKSFVCVKGAPGGDDYHTIWINPENPDIVLLASDQGATITVNAGRTWSIWYNQPTAQLYHVSTDNAFPYQVYGGQQESGSVAIASRGDHGAISYRDWQPVGVEEYGYVAPDPLNPDLVYGGKITRFDRRTGQTQDVSPEPVRRGKYRFLRTAPVLFSPADPRVLYLAGNVLFKTTSGGNSWDVISPDLSRETIDVPPSVGIYTKPEMKTMPRRGVIYTIAPSPKDGNVIWAGTDDGLIHVTRDGGKTWTNVTPPTLTSWSKVSLMDASHTDVETAYAAVNRIRCDDPQPHILRTRDGGKTWVEITAGLPPNGPVNAVREDPVRKGLLFAGTETAVHVSFDDGDHWQPLRLNMPATSIRDLVVHGDDLVVGTHGRSFWILDNLTTLRQLDPKVESASVHLFAPQLTHRLRRSLYTDTPVPPEEPVGQNPPDGAMLDYWLKADAKGPVTLEISDSNGKLVRRYASTDTPQPFDLEAQLPTYWMRPGRVLPATAGMHRWVWDLRHPDPEALEHEFPISAVFGDTPREPQGPLALPGRYTVKLTAGGTALTQTLTVKMDPRVKTSPEDLARQHDLSMKIFAAINRDAAALRDVEAVRKSRTGKVKDLEEKLAGISGAASPRRRGARGNPGLTQLNGQLVTLLGVVGGADVAPTTQAVAAFSDLENDLNALVSALNDLKAK